jgi:hypothetical protein
MHVLGCMHFVDQSISRERGVHLISLYMRLDVRLIPRYECYERARCLASSWTGREMKRQLSLKYIKNEPIGFSVTWRHYAMNPCSYASL